MITVIKKIIIKEKEGKRQGKITHVIDDSNLGPLFQRYGFTTRPQGLPGLHSAKSFYLDKTDVIFTVNTSKEV